MTVRTIEYLLDKFGAGKSPGSSEYVDLIDTLADDRNAVYFSATAPADTAANPLWFNTGTNVLSVYDGGWVTAGGAQGPEGPAGATGATGATGSAGTNGSNGTDGKTILNGSGTPSAETGVNGDFYIDTTNNLIFGPKTSGTWGSGTSIIGPTGAQGTQGATGATGATGAAAAGIIPNFVSGAYYRTPSSIAAPITVTNQTAYYAPIYIPTETTFDRIGLLTAATFSGTSSVRLGIYNSGTTGYPTTLVLDAGTVAPTAASTGYQITISQTLNAGVYWLALCQQTAPTTGTYTGTATGTSAMNFLIPSAVTFGAAGTLQGYSQASVTGAFADAGTLDRSSVSIHTYIRAV
jgi:hypothetical protein